jgi:hypothetical protein
MYMFSRDQRYDVRKQSNFKPRNGFAATLGGYEDTLAGRPARDLPPG